MCALKASLSELKIYGPKGNPDAEAGAAMYTEMPWDEFQQKKMEDEAKKLHAAKGVGDGSHLELKIPKADYSFQDKNAMISASLTIQVHHWHIYADLSDFFFSSVNQCSRVWG